MTEPISFKELLQAFGWGRKPEASRPPVPEPSSQPVPRSFNEGGGASLGSAGAGDEIHPVPPPVANPVPPRSEAYLNRRKGRKSGSEVHLQLFTQFLACLEREGVMTPGALAQELGVPRSTLNYYLKVFLDHPNRKQESPRYLLDHWTGRVLERNLAGRRLERLGAGRSVRYRLVSDPPSMTEG